MRSVASCCLCCICLRINWGNHPKASQHLSGIPVPYSCVSKLLKLLQGCFTRKTSQHVTEQINRQKFPYAEEDPKSGDKRKGRNWRPGRSWETELENPGTKSSFYEYVYCAAIWADLMWQWTGKWVKRSPVQSQLELNSSSKCLV